MGITNLGGLTTQGNQAAAIVAQSIGGGSGTGGVGNAKSGSKPGDFTQSDEPVKTVHLTFALGGNGGAGGAGGNESVDVAGDDPIVTTGSGAPGVVAQSIGGGGGTGGSTDPAAKDSGSPASDSPGPVGATTGGDDEEESGSYAATVTVGGRGGTAGNGARVSAGNYPPGSITTLGAHAHGIVAQPIGGGGAGGAGGADVYASNSGGILTAGYGAIGIMAQSIGGGYGADGTVNADASIWIGLVNTGSGGAGGAGGLVSVSSTGSLGTRGDDAPTILAQSIGGGGGAASAGCTNSISPGFNSRPRPARATPISASAGRSIPGTAPARSR